MPPRAGDVPIEVRSAFEAGVFAIPERPDPLSTSTTQALWRIPVILVGFSDMPLVYPPSTFEVSLFDATGAIPTGSAREYWDWVSDGKLQLAGDVVAAINLPRTREFYAFNSWGLNTVATPNNMYGMIRDALNGIELQQAVDWSRYDGNSDGYVDMLWVVHAGVGGDAQPWDRNNMWSITSAMSNQWRYGDAYVTEDLIPGSSTQHIRIDRFAMLPEMSGLRPGEPSEIGVYCHEFGHALGLPDLYDTSQLGGASNAGPGNWSLMATGGWGGNGRSPQSPTHLGAWPSVFLGWKDPVRPDQNGTMRLAPLGAGGDVLELWFQGEGHPEHFLIENRQREGFDQFLPNDGLIVYHLDEAIIGTRLPSNRINWGVTPGLRVVEADADTDLVVGGNRGDGNDPFPGDLGVTELDDYTSPNLRTFLGRITQLRLGNIAHDGADMVFDVQVRAPGWLPPIDANEAGYAPVEAGTAPSAFRTADGALQLLKLEVVSGKPQVVWRTRTNGAWQPGIQLTQTPGYILDIDAAPLPGGGMAVVWTDTRTGAARLHYRTRLGSTWSQDHVISTPPGDARNPSIAVDAQGVVHLAWLQHESGPAQIRFMRFAYTSPWGTVHAVTDTTLPEPPDVVIRPSGGAYLLWSDRDAPAPQIFFSRFHPDSGLRGPLNLTPSAFGAQTAVRGVATEDGTLHSVWRETNTGVSRLRYQRRTPEGFPNPPDEILVAHGSTLESHSLAVDPEGGLHLAFQRQVDNTFQACYQRSVPEYGWDLLPTNLTEPDGDDATLPVPVPESVGNVTVVFTSHQGGVPRLMTRERHLEPGGGTVSVEPLARLSAAGLLLRPNPIRAGQAMSIQWSTPLPAAEATLDVYDVNGRRVTEVRLGPDRSSEFVRIGPEQTARWPAGIYFARLRGSTAPAGRFVVLR